jgi:hypothetical protein
MLLIRHEQMQILSEYCVRQFEDRMFAHVGEVLPEESREMGEPEARRIIRVGVSRAGRYGFETESDVARFIELMFIFGEDLDENPELPWAAEILRDDSYESPTHKMDDLIDFAEAHQDEGL